MTRARRMTRAWRVTRVRRLTWAGHLADGPLDDGEGGAPGGEGAEVIGSLQGDTGQGAAEAVPPAGQGALALDRDRVGAQAAARGQGARAGVPAAVGGDAAADEYRVGTGQPGQRRRGRAWYHDQARHAECGGVAGQALPAVGARLG